MAFSEEIIAAAWDRQGGKCAYCGKDLDRRNRDSGEFGAWHPHHRKPEHLNGSDTLRNCVILCINPPNCHFNIGHGGVSWETYEPLSDSQLPYLYCGKKVVIVRFRQPMQAQIGKAIRKKRQRLNRYNRPKVIMPQISAIRRIK